jgi:hypothetical protein
VTSQIIFSSINENFPVPGQDNDTQVFRDNFGVIKTSLEDAQTEISDLQNFTAKLTDTTGGTVTNDFALSTISNAILTTTREEKWDYGNVTINDTTISFENGHYQILKVVGTNLNLVFADFPADPGLSGIRQTEGVGRIRLEIYADNTIRTITFNQPFGATVKKSGFPGAIFTHSSSINPVILEVWRYKSSTDNIYVRYLGQFE